VSGVLRAGYESQAQSPERRHERQALEEAQKIRIKLGVEPNLLEALPARPKGMRHATYSRLIGTLIAAEERVFGMALSPRSVGRNVGTT
jgi:hypothetical protein